MSCVSIETQAVEVILVDPVAGVGCYKLAHRTAVLAIEVDCLAPIGLVFLAEVGARKCTQIISIRSEVVIDDIEDNGDSMLVRGIDKRAHVVRCAVEPGRSEKVDAIVAPAEAAREVGDRHHLNHGDAGFGKLREFAPCALPVSLFGKCTDVHFVDDLALGCRSAPALVGPGERVGIDHL